MVEEVERIHADLKSCFLRDREVFRDGSVQVPESRTSHRSAADIARPNGSPGGRSDRNLLKRRDVQILERIPVIR